MVKIDRTIEFYQILWKVSRKDKYITKSINYFDSIIASLGQSGRKNVRVLKKADSKTDLEEMYDILIEDRTRGKRNEKEWAIFKVRKSGLPSKYDTASFTRTPNLFSKNEGLDETVHFKVYSGAILVSEYNFYGVRIRSTLSKFINDYLKKKKKNYRCIIKPILHEDVYEMIDKMTRVQSTKIKVASNYAKELTKKNGSFAKIFSSAEAIDNMNITINWSVSKGSVDTDKFPIIDPIKELVRMIKEGKAKDELKSLKVRGAVGTSNNLDTVDFLKDLMKTVKKVTLIDPRQKIVDTTDILNKIGEAYADNSDYLSGYVRK